MSMMPVNAGGPGAVDMTGKLGLRPRPKPGPRLRLRPRPKPSTRLRPRPTRPTPFLLAITEIKPRPRYCTYMYSMA